MVGEKTSSMNTAAMTDYARGFLVSPKGFVTTVPHWWKRATFGLLDIEVDPRVQSSISGNNVAFIGHAINIKTGESHIHSHIKRLNDALESNICSFHDAVNDLCGRFIIIYLWEGTPRLFQDPIGLRSAFFSNVFEGVVVGSHSRLVADQTNATVSRFAGPSYLKENNMAVLPGVATDFECVTTLTPNTEVSLHSGVVRRFYFGREEQLLSAAEASNIILRNIKAQLPALRTVKPLYVSLSAGLDSRVTTAALREVVRDITFFTYDFQFRTKNRASRYDRDTAINLVNRFDLNHVMVNIKDRNIPTELKRSLDRNSSKAHSRTLAAAYLEQLGSGLHLRSNAYEIGRAYYQAQERQHSAQTGAEMLAVVSMGKSADTYAADEYQRFIDSTSFEEVSGIDPLDLFYWEHRMGVWMTPVLLESDVAHDTHILVNHRPTLEAMLSVSQEDRIAGSIFERIIDSQWSDLFEIPINGVIRSGTEPE